MFNMKKLFTLTLLALGFMNLSSQAQVMYPYTFSKSTATYSDLVGATNLTAGNAWDDTLMTIPLGFTFKWALQNRNIDSITIDSYGLLFAPQDYDANTEFFSRAIMPYQADLTDRGYNTNQVAVSPISYLTTGTAGNRICKIEFNNAGFYSDTTGLDSTNFQVWLYEGTNVIEFRYGPQGVADIATSFDGENGPWINLAYKFTFDLVNLTATADSCSYVSGNSTTAAAVNPTSPIDLDAPPSDFAFVGLPANGQVFKWTPLGSVSGVEDLENAFAGMKVYPTQMNDKLTIEHDGQVTHATLSDINGRVLFTYSTPAISNSFDVSSLSKGIYLLSLSDKENRIKTIKVVK
jgi:hypothetical protein